MWAEEVSNLYPLAFRTSATDHVSYLPILRGIYPWITDPSVKDRLPLTNAENVGLEPLHGD